MQCWHLGDPSSPTLPQLSSAELPKHLPNTKVADRLLLGHLPHWGQICLCGRLDAWPSLGLKALRYQMLFKERKLFISLQ